MHYQQTHRPSNKSKSLLRSIVLLLVLQALMPVGLMPGSIANGDFLKLCPNNISPALMAILHGSHHMHHGQESKEWLFDCPFGTLMLEQIFEGADHAASQIAVFSQSAVLNQITPKQRVANYEPRAPPYLRSS
jgi:hypothetical protein